MDSYGWTNDDVVSILFHEYVHVKQKFVDGLVLERDNEGKIATNKYKIYYGERDIQAALQGINEDMKVAGASMTEEDREKYYDILYQNRILPILEYIEQGDYYIVDGNEAYIASDIEAYGTELEVFGMRMSPEYRQLCEKNLNMKKQEYELIKNAEKL